MPPRWTDSASRAPQRWPRGFGRNTLLAEARRGLRMAAWRAVTYGDNTGDMEWWRTGVDCMRGRVDDVLARRGLEHAIPHRR